LVQIRDEALERLLPTNCYRLFSDGGEPDIAQTVVRKRKGRFILYSYDPDFLRELAYRPYQLSFLMVHEWLWDHMSSAEAIRRVVRFFHSKNIEGLSAAEIREVLRRLGAKRI
jgi:hypothetical protein